jgi:hypothetical protein
MGSQLRPARSARCGRRPATTPGRRWDAASTPRLDRCDISDHRDSEESTEPADSHEPIEKIDSADPTLPMEANDPTLPIERTEPREAIDRTLSCDQSDQREAGRENAGEPELVMSAACQPPAVAEHFDRGEPVRLRLR